MAPPISSLTATLVMRSTRLARWLVPAAISIEAPRGEISAANLTWAGGYAEVPVWIGSSGLATVDPAAIALQHGTATVCESTVYVGAPPDKRCLRGRAQGFVCRTPWTSASCVGQGGGSPDPRLLYTATHHWSQHGKTLHVIARPPRDWQLVYCGVMLLVLTAAARQVVSRTISRLDVAALASGVLILGVFEGGTIPPHLYNVETAAAITLGAVAGVAVGAAMDPRASSVEPFRATVEAAACAAVAASFPQSLAGPGPAQVVSLICGGAIVAVSGRASNGATLPAVLWSVAALVYPTIVDSHVAPADDWTNAILATLLAAVIFAISAGWQRGPGRGTPATP